MLPSAAELVANYLRTNGYTETLARFINEAGLSPDTGSTPSSGITIDQILQEKKTYDLSVNFERLGIKDHAKEWSKPAPSVPLVIETSFTRSNILSVHVMELLLPGSAEARSCIVATTADRRIDLFDPNSSPPCLLQSLSGLQDSPVLDLIVLEARYLLIASMSGRLALYDTATEQVLNTRRDHMKYIVKLASWSEGGTAIVSTASWDSKIFLYNLNIHDAAKPQLREPFATVTLPSIPETILFITSPHTQKPILLLTRRDSTFLHYFDLPAPSVTMSEIPLLGKQNLAPHSIAWVAFTPADVHLCPTDQSIVAVATSSTPHMKLLVVRLLVPKPLARSNSEVTQASVEVTGLNTDDSVETPYVTQAGQAQAELLIQNREEAAIMINTSTMAPQTSYSTPKLTWRPDASGIYVNSDDGVVRGFEVSTGKHIVSLEAHTNGSKIRCLVASTRAVGDLQDEDEEYLVTGGFDQNLIAWRIN